MRNLYSSPLKVYLALGLVTLCGILSGFSLPISLFPNTTKPMIRVSFNYDESHDEFLNQQGSLIEGSLKSISTSELEVENIEARYTPGSVDYTIDFRWGADPKLALREVQAIMNQRVALLSQRSRDSLNVYSYNESGGFFAVSFFSEELSTTELYNVLKNAFASKLSEIKEAEEALVWNPENKRVSIELNPNKMAYYQILPKTVESNVATAIEGLSAGSLIEGSKNIPLILEPRAKTVENLKSVLILGGKSPVPLSDLAKVEVTTPPEGSRVIKTSGVTSVMIWAMPKAGGNIKKMSEDIGKIIKDTMPTLPSHIKYKVLVDPSIYIRSAIVNVIKEVGLAALLCVLVLFLFIGSFKNVITAAIEIPISLVIAFILMKLSNMNLNLISLGGLALSAGMNVDASVVVMENIFRHFEEAKKDLTYSEKLDLIMKAVGEVRLPIVASTIASIVVFLPLIFTHGLGSAILGDLAKSVVFSHGFSAIVALVLVPTVRLQMLSYGNIKEHQSILENSFKKLELFYSRTLEKFIQHVSLQNLVYLSLTASLILLGVFVFPRLPKEIIGRPDTDWIFIGVRSTDNTLFKQMETDMDEIDAKISEEFGNKVLYTFAQIQRPKFGNLLVRIADQKQMKEVKSKMEQVFTDTSRLRFNFEEWNPSELPIPDPPQLQVNVESLDPKTQADATASLVSVFQENQLFKRIVSDPDTERQDSYKITPHFDQWPAQYGTGQWLNYRELAEFVRIATNGKTIGELQIDNENKRVVISYPKNTVSDLEHIEALPLMINEKIVPLKALLTFTKQNILPTIYRYNQKTQYRIYGREYDLDRKTTSERLTKADELLNQWKTTYPQAQKNQVTAHIEDSDKDLNESLHELFIALGISILLIFVTMVFQLGGIIPSLLVMAAIPLGIIGVILSLWIFKSTLSINSALGIILLNGLVVANSIILVDFLTRKVNEGFSPIDAAKSAAQVRLRPILLTSLTTGLGMLPVALGLGEGGRVLQPLGITVLGGLFFSLITTLYIVPALQVRYLMAKTKKAESL